METGRCAWAERGGEIDIAYHDAEWGVPVHDDQRLFEFVTLEGAQAGLSWSTILNKREGYRRAFAEFDPTLVARFDARTIERLLLDPSIVRNRLKVESTVANARAFLAIREEFGSFDSFIWSFVDNAPLQPHRRRHSDIPATTPLSDTVSKELRGRGFRFVGSTICYAFMQAVGMVNDHTVDCFRYHEVAALA